jgi:asparagine synthase (glutamine-hydrolysing)
MGMAGWYGQWRGREKWQRLSYMAQESSYETAYLAIRGFFAPQQILRLLDMDSREFGQIVETHLEAAREESGMEGAAAFAGMEIRRYLHDQLLRDTDVFSMAHSVEVRVPYLDAAVVDTAAGAERRGSAGIHKPLLVGAIGDALVTELAGNSKRSFTLPMAAWMRSSRGPLRETAGQGGFLNRAAAGSLWGQFEAGRLHWSRAWALVVMGAAHAS